MTPGILLATALAGFVYGITPGPGVLAVFGIGADRGRRAAASFLLGHLAGDVLWSTLALVAIIGVTSFGTVVFDLLGILSGLYLFWLGWRAVRTSRSALADGEGAMRSPLRHGLVFGATNPKAYPVALATLTALLSAKAALLGWGMLPALVLASCLGGLAGYLILVLLVGAAPVRRFYRRHQLMITRLSGLLFIGFAAHVLAHSVSGLARARG
ncbi:Threonine/homoserine/homoserine lactone efflux protein [Faunimonas pinastri]|uniref:Threonine/homoserine/homoserine lactone efflux protein n=1 Tax=Faunimonas pinastri TaxID=1855383 RepID=A0A1H9LXL5_9HYPH|nr:LysE family translocator [Faunimonas pinastri]SER16029.1 Threonine/homoserine/homoserine lactone efflux protein [Faunimonas pinastri]